MDTKGEILEDNQINLQQTFNNDFLKYEKKKNLRNSLLTWGVTLIAIEIIFNIMILILLALGLGFSGECDYDDEKRRRECDKKSKNDEKYFNIALEFIMNV